MRTAAHIFIPMAGKQAGRHTEIRQRVRDRNKNAFSTVIMSIFAFWLSRLYSVYRGISPLTTAPCRYPTATEKLAESSFPFLFVCAGSLLLPCVVRACFSLLPLLWLFIFCFFFFLLILWFSISIRSLHIAVYSLCDNYRIQENKQIIINQTSHVLLCACVLCFFTQ